VAHSRKLILAFAALLLATATLALAQGTYTQIDYPGALDTYCNGIDTAGDISGYYIDATGGYGFLLSNGTYTSIAHPDSTNTELFGMNDVGEVVGYSSVGFSYNVATQKFTTISFPNAYITFPFAVNDSGTVVGYIEGENNVKLGFQLNSSGRGTSIFLPGALDTETYGITTAGEVVGSAYDRGGPYVNFSFEKGKYKTALPNVQGAIVLGINPAGTALVGYYTLHFPAGFLYQSETITTLQFPDSIQTIANGVNNVGEVVGSFEDSSGNIHGFTWTPPADAAKK